ncbi:MAG TPA: hypothetical protein VJQ47_13950 [Steroidobacteraceae bacterium]|nr:hypothetical protein [Steroidobacteraceae bacterium]
MIICTFDDRTTDIIGLKLLICSLNRYMPDVPVRLFCPVADGAFADWLADYPRVSLCADPQMKGMGWNVKPLLLQRLLDEGHDSVVWMDSDIIVTGDYRSLLPPGDELVVTQEAALTPYGVRQRTLGWQLPLARTLLGVNTCLIRAQPAHRRVIQAWQEKLQHADYQAAQQLPFERRPPHMMTDQDVLLALLGSRDFSNIEVCILRAGAAIIQQSGIPGYPPAQRIAHLIRGMPPLVHSQSFKPWRFPTVPSLLTQPRAFFVCLYLETSPYTHYARQYRGQIQDFPSCLKTRTAWGRVSRLLSLGQPCLGGITQAAAATSWKHCVDLLGLLGRIRRKMIYHLGGLAKRATSP